MTRLLSPLANREFLATVDVDLFTGDQCERIVSMLDDGSWDPAQVTYPDQPGGQVHPQTRSVLAQPCPMSVDGWPLSSVLDVVATLNARLWRYDVDGLAAFDLPSVLLYEAAVADHFRPHTDAGPYTSTRKLSFSVQLSTPDSYRGGDVVFRDPNKIGSRTQGSLTVFSSLTPHEVTPVIRGSRLALVGWIHGPSFR